MIKLMFSFLFGLAFFAANGQTKQASYWLTLPDQSALLQRNEIKLSQHRDSSMPFIRIDASQQFQSIDGFGFTLTGGSALLIQQMTPKARKSLLQELFGKGSNAVSISYLRISVGASDLSEKVFSYNDLPEGKTDPLLQNFSLANDTLYLLPLLKEILAINPSIKIMATPWSPPIWMKTNQQSIGGRLIPQYYDTYARYLLKYIQAMREQGIPIHALTIQNEPQHGGNNPSMLMSAAEQAAFIRDHLGPLFALHQVNTKLIIWDHNADHPEYPIEVLNDSVANRFIDGSAFHLYAGDISALSVVKKAFPNKHIYFTEQWTGSKGEFGGDLIWHIQQVLIGALQNHSKIVLEWNLANDSGYGPHTPGGCTECKGALTIHGNQISRNVAYYIIAHAAKFIPPGSVRIHTAASTKIPSVAFLTPNGNKVLILLNNMQAMEKVQILNHQAIATLALKPGAVVTIVFK